MAPLALCIPVLFPHSLSLSRSPPLSLNLVCKKETESVKALKTIGFPALFENAVTEVCGEFVA